MDGEICLDALEAGAIWEVVVETFGSGFQLAEPLLDTVAQPKRHVPEPQTQLHESPRIPRPFIHEDEGLIAAQPQDLSHE